MRFTNTRFVRTARRTFPIWLCALALVLVSACSSGDPTPTPTPTLTRTPTPTITPPGGLPKLATAAPFVTVTPFPTGAGPITAPTRALPSPRAGASLPAAFTPEPLVTVTAFPTADAITPSAPRATVTEPTLRAGVTLPPTFTPVPFLTITARPTNAILAGTQVTAIPPAVDFTNPPPPPDSDAAWYEDCSAFRLDRAKSQLFITRRGESMLEWGGVPEATAYRIWLLGPAGVFTLRQSVPEPRILLTNTSPARVLFDTVGAYAFEIVAYRGDTPICTHITDIIIVR